MTFTNTECLRSRQDFPALTREIGSHPVAFLDGPGGTQVPHAVLDAIRASYVNRNANFDGRFRTSQDVGAAVNAARNAVADFLGAASGAEISFGANMTTLNFSLSHALVRTMQTGDEIVITELDHEANRGPWLNLRERGMVVREVKLKPSGHLDLDDFAKQITSRTRLVAMGLASNSLGTVTSVNLARKLCDDVGALLVVDAVHYAAHFPMDVKNLGADFLLCSAYKFYGPHIGILYSRSGLLDSLNPDYLCTQKSAAPYRIETGTLNHAAIAGVQACIDYLATWGTGDSRRAQIMSAMSDLHHYESELADYYYESIKSLPKVHVWGPGFDGSPRSPTVSLSVEKMMPETIAADLGAQGLQVWHGHFYALKVLEVLGLVDKGGLLRIGISMYNTRSEIDRLLTALETITKSLPS
ncbi:MAG: cysteine desulfurase-like protein [Proteobacteria bacterium]|nr:cysteine desulfurase-like protein [Pseudomonadota bacterium]